jgi:hypothetical protein
MSKIPLLALAFAAGVLLLGVNCNAQFSGADANTMMNAYNTAFLTTSGGNSHFDTGFWGEAEQIEGVIDAYNRSGNAAYLTEITQLLNGFSATNGTNWSGNIYNDDCMWACIAYLRGYQATGNSTFLTIATANFNMVWARGWDTSAGGLWWTTADASKNSCDEDPAAIVACLLYQATGNATYQADARALYNWELSHLYNPSTGQISDYYASGQANGGATTYNQGTFIGAADYLGDVTNATLAANFLMGSGGLLQDYGEANNNSGFNGIAIRWVAKFMKDYNLENNYLAWLQYNANTAFRIRNSSDNLSWCSWELPTPGGTLDDWSCISSVIAVQDVPPSFPYTYVTAENGSTNLSVPADVAFGVNGNYTYQYAVSGNVTFNTATFGDPDYGVVKSGFDTPFTPCALENGSYAFTVPVEVAFGSQGKYDYLPGVSGTVIFNTNTFGGDPDVGVSKAGYYMPYTFCALDGQTNTFSSPTDVAFGANGHYNFKYGVTGAIAYNTNNFGDPAVGMAKMGYYRAVGIPPAFGFTNSGFETPSAGTGYQYDPAGAGWTFSGASGLQGNGSAWGAPAAPYGTQTAFLQSATGMTNGNITQAVSFNSPGSYTLAFAAALTAIPNDAAVSLNVLVDGQVVGTCSPASTTSFTSYVTRPFNIATGGNHIVQFAVVGAAVDSSILIDAIALTGLANASFEAPNVGGASYQYNPAGGSWTFSGNSGIQGDGSAWGAPTAPSGTQTAFLQIINGADNGNMSEQFFCSPGTYTVSFAAALRASNNGSISLSVLLDGAVLGSFSPATTNRFAAYTTSSFTTTTAASHTLQFVAVGTTAVDASVFIDSVGVQSSAASTPVVISAGNTIPVNNFSFELNVASGSGGVVSTVPAGWTSFNEAGAADIGTQWSGGVDYTVYDPLAAPAAGNQYCFINMFKPGVTGGIYQDVGALQPYTTYTLTVAIGSRHDRINSPGIISLLNGTDNTAKVLVTGQGLPGSQNTWKNYAVTFTTGPSVTGDLTVELSVLGNGTTIQADFDNVQLTATPVVFKAPTLGTLKVSNGTLILTGGGGTPNGGYTWLTTTNLTPPINWTTNGTGTLDGAGAFSNAIPIIATQPAGFFRLRMP